MWIRTIGNKSFIWNDEQNQMAIIDKYGNKAKIELPISKEAFKRLYRNYRIAYSEWFRGVMNPPE